VKTPALRYPGGVIAPLACERCRRIAREGRIVAYLARVTCRACLRQIERARHGGIVGTGRYGEVRL